MRKLVYYVAITLDGQIAREDGRFDCFLQEGEHLAELCERFPETVPGAFRETLGVSGPAQRFDTVLMGRTTWAVGLEYGVESPYPHLKQLVVSRSLSVSPHPDIELLRENALERVRELKAARGMDIWLCGGGQLATALAPEIDEFILKVNPVLLGKGTPLFAGLPDAIQLELMERKVFDNGFLLLHFRRKP